jgi:hypothetical protein
VRTCCCVRPCICGSHHCCHLNAVRRGTSGIQACYLMPTFDLRTSQFPRCCDAPCPGCQHLRVLRASVTHKARVNMVWCAQYALCVACCAVQVHHVHSKSMHARFMYVRTTCIMIIIETSGDTPVISVMLGAAVHRGGCMSSSSHMYGQLCASRQLTDVSSGGLTV